MMDAPAPLDPWSLIGYLWKGVLTLGGALIGLHVKQSNQRLEALESAVGKKSDKGDTDKDVERIEDALKEHRQETREGFGQVNSRLDALMDRLAK